MSDMRAGATGAQEGIGGITETVSEQATRAKETGRRELREQLDERTTKVGRQARSLADAVRRSGQSLRSQGMDEMGVESITSGVADRLERAGGYLERARGDDMLRDAERFIRERPWLVTSAAAAAGFVASRVFKASSEGRYERSPGRTAMTPSQRFGDAARRSDDAEFMAPASRQTAATY
jgi:ElaB/YqjD/DUF883 family membrane-anchored ribosome-binding protein